MANTKDGWDDKRSTYVEDVTNNGLKRIKGEFYLQGVRFTFSFIETRQGEYLIRGHVGLRDPTSGHLLHIQGPARRERIDRETKKYGISREDAREKLSKKDSIKAKCECNLHETTLDAIKAAIENAAQKLLEENRDTLQGAHKTLPGDNSTLAQLFFHYGKKFLNSQGSVKEKTYKQKRSTLKTACLKFNMEARKIELKDIKKAFPNLGKSKADDGQLRQLQLFWDFCMANGVLQRDNPFRLFFSTYRIAKNEDTVKLQRKATTPKSLPERVETKLNDFISNASPTDVLTTGLLFIKEFGLNAKEVCNLTGENISSDSGNSTVCLIIKRENVTGATHTYIVPCSAFASREILRRIKALAIQPDQKKMRILKSATGQNISPKELTAFCRTSLLRAGMSYSDLQRDYSQPGGVGVRLLIANYHNRLAYICGLEEIDEGAVKYLSGQSLAGNVTADHYRSFTEPAGQKYLQQVLRIPLNQKAVRRRWKS